MDLIGVFNRLNRLLGIRVKDWERKELRQRDRDRWKDRVTTARDRQRSVSRCRHSVFLSNRETEGLRQRETETETDRERQRQRQ